jgi:hypothetical protein
MSVKRTGQNAFILLRLSTFIRNSPHIKGYSPMNLSAFFGYPSKVE